MAAWAIKNFGGLIPRTGSRNLPDSAAEQAVNCDLSSGYIEGLPIPVLIEDLSSFTGTQRAYRFPVANNPDVWIPLPSPFSSVVRSPLANDTAHRVYWTNPPDSSAPGQFWNTYARIAAGNTGGNAPYNTGTIQPSATASSITVGQLGGTAGVPEIARSYTWTYVNLYGEESAPEFPSNTISGLPDATWAVDGLPTSAPSNPGGKNYAPITGVNLYRTSTGTNTGAQFYLVEQFVFGVNDPPVEYDDNLPDATAVNNNPLPSASWANPPDGLTGLTMLAGGMLVGFTGNTVHFCEPDRPHAWPAAYDQSVQYDIVGFGIWQQSLVVLTSGFPFTGSGNSPSNFVFTEVRVPEPCISRGGIITDLLGVYYPSQNGLVMLNYYGMQNQTLSMLQKNDWLNIFDAAGIIACRHRAQYLALRTDSSGTGFLIDYSEQRLGIMELSTFEGATAVWNDEYTGDAYICAGGKVYRWDDPSANPQVFRWRSKQFYGPEPVTIGACQVTLDPAVLTATASTQTLTNSDSTLTLPSGKNAVVNIYAGPDGENLIMTLPLTAVRNIFRIPGGFKAFDWQIEIVSRVGVRSIELASTMRELRGV